MPFVIGLFFLSTILSLFVISSKLWDARHYTEIKNIIETTDISKIILNIMLGFLLFAGSLNTRWKDIKNQLKPVSLFAVGGVLLSTIIIAVLLYCICYLLGMSIDFIYCLLFGALISPTDPIAILGILTKAHVPKK
jgi:CPA1 family monovalent cation:H+ antiporter